MRQDLAGKIHADFVALMANETKELSRLTSERDRLDNERMKLLQAHYAGAVPIDLLKQEQDRIANQIGDIQHRLEAHHDEYASARANLDDSLGLLANIVSIYQRADDANRRLCNQAFFHRIFIEEEGDVRVEYETPFGALCDTEEQMNALNWAAEAKKKGEVQPGQRVVTLVEGLNLSHLGSLRRQFSNPTPKLKSLISRWKQGVYRVSQRVDSAPIQDGRGPCVRRIGKLQTFLSAAQVDQLVDDYLGGATVTDLAVKYEVHRATVSRHLTDNGVVRRSAGLHGGEAAEAVRLFRQGESLRGISRSIGASRDSIRRTLERYREIPQLTCRRITEQPSEESEDQMSRVGEVHLDDGPSADSRLESHDRYVPVVAT